MFQNYNLLETYYIFEKIEIKISFHIPFVLL